MRILTDTNILVRSVERAYPLMRIARDSLRHLYENGHELCVAPQVVAEFWNVCTRPVKVNGLGHDIAATGRLVTRIEALFTVLPDTPESYRAWRELVVKHQVCGAKVHDARLVALANTNDITTILTFNVSDFQRYASIKVIDPSSLP